MYSFCFLLNCIIPHLFQDLIQPIKCFIILIFTSNSFFSCLDQFCICFLIFQIFLGSGALSGILGYELRCLCIPRQCHLDLSHKQSRFQSTLNTK